MPDVRKRIEFGEIRIGDIARQNVVKALDSNWITAGPMVEEFERQWSDLFGYAATCAVSSGTDADINCCFALYDHCHPRGKPTRRGDEVITPALSFIATANAIQAAGLKPVCVDINRSTLNIDPFKITSAITPQTRAIMVVHTMGRPCDMDTICHIAADHGLWVIEDCCEAHGASYKGIAVGKFGLVAAFSYYLAHLVCCSEGGACSTMWPAVATTIRSTRSHGRRNGELYFDFPRTGLNSKMTDLEAAIGLEGIANFKKTFDRRKTVVARVRDALTPYEHLAWFSEEDAGNVNCPHGFSITTKDPKHFAPLCKALEDASIHWKRNFGSIPTQHGAFAHLGYRLGDFPEAEYVGDYGMHFGVHQYLTDEDVEYICETLIRFFGRL